MNTIETFQFLFKSNAKDATEDNKKLNSSLDKIKQTKEDLARAEEAYIATLTKEDAALFKLKKTKEDVNKAEREHRLLMQQKSKETIQQQRELNDATSDFVNMIQKGAGLAAGFVGITSVAGEFGKVYNQNYKTAYTSDLYNQDPKTLRTFEAMARQLGGAGAGEAAMGFLDEKFQFARAHNISFDAKDFIENIYRTIHINGEKTTREMMGFQAEQFGLPPALQRMFMLPRNEFDAKWKQTEATIPTDIDNKKILEVEEKSQRLQTNVDKLIANIEYRTLDPINKILEKTNEVIEAKHPLAKVPLSSFSAMHSIFSAASSYFEGQDLIEKANANKKSKENLVTIAGDKAQIPSSDGSIQGNAKVAWSMLKSAGATDEMAAAALGNLNGESTMWTNKKRGDGGKSAGGFQWDAERRAYIKEALGIDVETAPIEDQMKAFIYDAKRRGNWDVANKMSTAGATEYLDRQFEISANIGNEDVKNRTKWASQYYNEFSGSGSGGANVKVDNITINTMATDGQQVVKAIEDWAGTWVNSTFQHFDNGKQ